MGVAIGRELGLSQKRIDAVADWRASPDLTDGERLVLEFTEAITATPAHVSADLGDRLRADFSEKQLVELANSISWENARARFNRAFNIEPEGYVLGDA